MKSKITLSWATLLMCVVLIGCSIHKGGHVRQRKMLSQREVIKEWVKGSEETITFVPEQVPFHYNTDTISCDFLLVPKGRDIPLNVVEDQLYGYAGAIYQALWLYVLPELKERCYVNSAVSPAFPVSSRGLSLRIEHIHENRCVQAEDIYLVEDTVVYHYGREELASIGWHNEECNNFRFDIPANKTGKERFWMIKMYNTDRRDDDEENRIYKLLNHEDVTGRHPLRAELCFIQVTDTVFPERIYNDGNWKYQKYIPDIDKYW